MKILLGCVFAIFSLSAHAAVVLSDDFSAAIPGSWTVIDNEGNGVVWSNIAGCGESGNYTDGTGDAACVSSDIFGTAEYDTELLTPSMDLSLFTNTMLDLSANFRNLSTDLFEIDVSIDSGTTWTNELSWNADYGGFFAPPGEPISLNLSAYDGQANVMIRFHYYNPDIDDWDWYIQIDDVVVSGDQTVVAVPATPVPTLGFWALAILLSLVISSTLLLNRKSL